MAIAGEQKAGIGRGFVVLVGVREGDAEADAKFLAEKTANLRIFPDENDKMNRSIREVDGGAVLAISQFTLYADTRKGNRPSFVKAAPPDVAEKLYETYVAVLRELLGPDRVKTGVFRAMMSVEIVNDGPVTIELTSDRE